MLSAKAVLTLLLVLLAAVTILFCVVWGRELSFRKKWRWPTWYQAVVGFITDFLDTLGVGSFATTTTLLRLRRNVADEKIPGTLNVGHSLPTITEAFLYITIIEVEMSTLVTLIVASVLGAWLGAGVVTRLPRRRIQIGMGVALLVAASLILGRLRNVFPSGGDALGLEGFQLVIAIVGCLGIGALMTIGIGAYAPIMIMVSLLGMNPKAAFPIMMGACAFLMPISGLRFIRTETYDPQASLGLTAGGLPGVFLAAFLVRELRLDVVRWLVVAVVIYTAFSLLRAARAERPVAQFDAE